MAWRAETDIDAASFVIGLDVGGVATHVAQRGVASILVNRMPQLGRWELGRPRAELRVADDLISSLLTRERLPEAAHAAVGLAAPAWFGVGERTRLADVVDPGRRHRLVATTTTLAAVAGSGVEDDAPVLAIDVGLGVSASIVGATAAGMVEFGAVGVPPHRLRGLASRATITPASRVRDLALRSLVDDVRRLVRWSASAMLIVDPPDEHTVDELRAVIAATGWHVDRIEVLNGRSAVAKGAAAIAEAAHVVTASTSVPRSGHAGRDGDDRSTMLLDPPQPGRRWSWVLPRSLGVLTEAAAAESAAAESAAAESAAAGTDRVASVHTVVDRGVRVPVEVVQGFDLGPDDGSSVFLDLHEQDEQHEQLDGPAVHRLVATATWAAGASHPPDAEIAFVVDVDGRFRLEPVDDWHLEWHEQEIVVRAVRPGHVDAGRAAGPDRASVRSVPRVHPSVAPAPVARRTPEEPIPPVGVALMRCERLLSFEVGELVGLRSAFALLGCADDPAEVEVAAARLEQAVAGRDDELARAIRTAIDAIHAELERGTEAWYFGGTANEVASEVARVVEHLAVVVGEVSVPERRRLERDALLLGLAPDAARSLVDELMRTARVGRDVRAVAPGADAAGVAEWRDVRLDPELGCFVLDAGDTSEPSTSAVRIRVVIDRR